MRRAHAATARQFELGADERFGAARCQRESASRAEPDRFVGANITRDDLYVSEARFASPTIVGLAGRAGRRGAAADARWCDEGARRFVAPPTERVSRGARGCVIR